MLPGIIGGGENEISLDDIRGFSGLAGVIGLAGVLYSGLGWVSALRDALIAVFELPDNEQPSFVLGKLRDLLTLAADRLRPAGLGGRGRAGVAGSPTPCSTGSASAPSWAGSW